MKFKLYLENTELTNLAPFDEIKKHATASSELYSDDDNFMVVRAKSHASACYYGSFTKSRFCIANPDDTSEFDKIGEVKGMGGGESKFFYVFAKKISLKNKNSILGIMVYPKRMSNLVQNMSVSEIVAQGKARFYEMFKKDFSYSDEFLEKWVKEVLAEGRFFESYNSSNKIILPTELKVLIGPKLYSEILK